MEVKINVDETQLKDILDKELIDLPKEVLQDVIVQSIKGYFEQNNYENVQKLFLNENKSYYQYNTSLTSTEFLNKLVKDCDYSELQSVVDEAIKDVKENHRSIVCDLISGIITKGMFEDYQFKYHLENSVRDIIASMHRPHN